MIADPISRGENVGQALFFAVCAALLVGLGVGVHSFYEWDVAQYQLLEAWDECHG